MNIIFIIVLLAIIAIIISKKVMFDYKIEGMTADEAVKNIASLYNTTKLTITDLTSTGTATLNNATVTNGTINTATIPTLNSTTGTITNLNATKGNITGGLTVKSGLNADTGTIGTTTLGSTTINGNLNVSGTSNLTKGMQAIVLVSSNWDAGKFKDQIIAGKYFTKDMQDGTTLRFIFVYPNKTQANTHIWHGVAVKMGNQFLLYEITPTHKDVGNVWSAKSNNGTWRGDIN